MMRSQSGAAMVLVLIFLGVGALLLVPTIQYASAALNFMSASRSTAEVQHGLNALNDQALAMLQHTTEWDCDGGGGLDTFADCVAAHGAWTLATASHLGGIPNETEVDPINGQEMKVTIAPLAIPVPDGKATTLGGGTPSCLTYWLTRAPDWVKAGVPENYQPVTYTLNLENCGTGNRNIRRMVAVLDEPFHYVFGSSGGTIWGQEDFGDGDGNGDGNGGQQGQGPDPEPGTVGRCEGEDTPYYGCQEADNALFLAWPSHDDVYSGPNQLRIKPGEVMTLTFRVWPDTAGFHYGAAKVCFGEAAGCDQRISQVAHNRTAGIMSGLFSISGQGKGHVYGAAAKLDSDGARLVSQHPE